MENPDATGERDREIITVVKVKYGKTIDLEAAKRNSNQPQIARAIFTGPSIVFGGITSYYHLNTMLKLAFGEDDAREILSLAWYLASEGDALINIAVPPDISNICIVPQIRRLTILY